MSGHRSFSELTKNFSPERKARIAGRTRATLEEMTLAELRKARDLTQKELARELDVEQPAVARMEQRADMYVSNLRRYVEAMGGKLEIVATFPDGSVKITNFAEIAAGK